MLRLALLKRWRIAERDDSLPSDTRTKALELVQAAKGALRELSDPRRRAAYDQTLGPAPAEDDRGADPAGRGGTTPPADAPATDSSLERGLARLRDGQYRIAITLLEKARVDDPSSPEVLAALGWATWKAHGDASADDAEDFLKLALTFAPRSGQAIEYLARIALAREDAEQARVYLLRFLKQQPKAQWARDALASLPEPPAPGEEDPANRRFWRKGGPA